MARLVTVKITDFNSIRSNADYASEGGWSLARYVSAHPAYDGILWVITSAAVTDSGNKMADTAIDQLGAAQVNGQVITTSDWYTMGSTTTTTSGGGGVPVSTNQYPQPTPTATSGQAAPSATGLTATASSIKSTLVKNKLLVIGVVVVVVVAAVYFVTKNGKRRGSNYV